MDRVMRAQENARMGFMAAALRQREVEDLARSARDRVRRNHFGPGLEAIFRRYSL
jgi:hypothetical protein